MQRPSRPTSLVAVLSVVLCFGVPASASPEKDALKQFTAHGNAVAKDLKGKLGQRRKAFESKIEDFIAAAKNADDFVISISFLTADTENFQEGVRDDVAAAIQDVASNCATTLDQLGTPEVLQGTYPNGFYTGTGGAKDAIDAKLRKLVTQMYSKLRSRFEDAREQLDAHGVLFNFDVGSSADGRAWAPNPVMTGFVQAPEMTIDFAFCAGRAGVYADTLFAFGGNAPVAGGDVTISVVRPNGSTSFSVTPTAASRYRQVGYPGVHPTSEGNYMFVVGHDGSVEAQRALGLR